MIFIGLHLVAQCCINIIFGMLLKKMKIFRYYLKPQNYFPYSLIQTLIIVPTQIVNLISYLYCMLAFFFSFVTLFFVIILDNTGSFCTNLFQYYQLLIYLYEIPKRDTICPFLVIVVETRE